jgi:MFS family permease
VTYLGVILALLIIRLPPQTVHSADQKLMGSLVNGLKYTWDNRVIRGLMLIVALASFLTIPYIALMPVFAKDVLHAGPDVLGFLLTAVGIGAILGGLIVACLQEGRRGLWLVLFNVIGSVFLLIFCISGSIPLSMVFVMLLGSSNAIRQTLANSLIQLNTAEAYHGRVMSVFNLLLNGMSRVGALLIGAMAEFINAPIALGLSALLGVIFGLFILYRMPVLRRLR